MIDAAPSAASRASGVRMPAASSRISLNTCSFRVAAAVATRVPQSWLCESTVPRATVPRLSLRSLAYSGSASFRFSIDTVTQPS
ncbi:Uncharacterised protein [Mycobacteroides abscessus subsp. abscessus]|nr:Uncharacterised protein [Mycobacteroides abscessus subsp. abscessus]